jgi:predicted AAA+ superfamily ATPase
VPVFGPRQSGKTTLTQMTFPDKLYYSLEDPDLRMAVETDPRGFLANLSDLTGRKRQWKVKTRPLEYLGRC